MIDWRQLGIAFLISMLPGLLLAIKEFNSADTELLQKMLTVGFGAVWLSVLILYAANYFRGTI